MHFKCICLFYATKILVLTNDKLLVGEIRFTHFDRRRKKRLLVMSCGLWVAGYNSAWQSRTFSNLVSIVSNLLIKQYHSYFLSPPRFLLNPSYVGDTASTGFRYAGRNKKPREQTAQHLLFIRQPAY